VPAVFNAANEQAVAAFLSQKLTFTGISHILMRILDEADHVRAEPNSISDVLAAEDWARSRADELIGRA
jgi:1-deoxy-D-xylulose-5-phosphate reductoisomerase